MSCRIEIRKIVSQNTVLIHSRVSVQVIGPMCDDMNTIVKYCILESTLELIVNKIQVVDGV